MKLGSIPLMVAVALALNSPLAVAAATVPAAVAPAASQLDQCEAAYRRADFATGYRLCLPLAEQGDSWAQAALGVAYEQGRGVPQDYAAAVSWYRRAAEQGNADAQLNLGFMYNPRECLVRGSL